MAIDSNNSLTFKHISHATNEAVQYIDDRRRGAIKSLKTKWKKFNYTAMGGIEVNTIYTIAGISGSGKSAFLNSLESDLFDLNTNIDFIVLSFSLEMLSFKQIGRKLSYKLKKTTSELYTVEEALSDSDFKKVEEESKKIRNYPIYYVDTPGTVSEIKNTIDVFRELYAKNKWLIVDFDHVLLTKSTAGESERSTLVNLQRLFIEEKKIGMTTIIQLSQLNREIEEISRITNPSLHFPQRRDLAGSDAMFFASDYIIILHTPEKLGIRTYGISNWPVDNMIYMHWLKCREGEPKILSFVNNLKYNSIEEYSQTTI